jgi:hypothetical protein
MRNTFHAQRIGRVMSNSFFHAQASVRKWGGTTDDYIGIHEWVDGSKKSFGDVRHRALLHSTFGVWIAQDVFGRVVQVQKKTGGVKDVAVREIVEQHIIEDLGFIPSPGDWLENMDIKAWMGGKKTKVLSSGALLDDTVKVGK